MAVEDGDPIQPPEGAVAENYVRRRLQLYSPAVLAGGGEQASSRTGSGVYEVFAMWLRCGCDVIAK